MKLSLVGTTRSLLLPVLTLCDDASFDFRIEN
jgi:hypothetical protein